MASVFHQMRRSQNEVLSTAIKAARGAGHPVGLAEDMARAALWLCVNGFDGVGALMAELRSETGAIEYENGRDGLVLKGASTACLAVCAIDALAARMSQKAVLENVSNPLILLGICACGSRELGTKINVGDWAQVTHGEIDHMGSDAHFGAYRLTLSDPDHALKVAEPSGPLEIEDHRWSVLEAMAARTYVPASTESRAKGAGAGLTDND